MVLFHCDGLLTASSIAVGLTALICAAHAIRIWHVRSRSVLARHYITVVLTPVATTAYGFAMYWVSDGVGVLIASVTSVVQAAALIATWKVYLWWAGGKAAFIAWHDDVSSRNRCRIPLIKLPACKFAHGKKAVRFKELSIYQLLVVRPPCMLLMAITIFIVGDLRVGLRYIFRGPAIISTILAMQNLADVGILCRKAVNAPRQILKLGAAQLPIIFTILQVNLIILLVHVGAITPTEEVSCPYNLYSDTPPSSELKARQLASVVLVFECLFLAALTVLAFPIKDLTSRTSFETGDEDREKLLDEALEVSAQTVLGIHAAAIPFLLALVCGKLLLLFGAPVV